jgi:hypothetical protein
VSTKQLMMACLNCPELGGNRAPADIIRRQASTGVLNCEKGGRLQITRAWRRGYATTSDVKSTGRTPRRENPVAVKSCPRAICSVCEIVRTGYAANRHTDYLRGLWQIPRGCDLRNCLGILNVCSKPSAAVQGHPKVPENVAECGHRNRKRDCSVSGQGPGILPIQ